MKLPLSWLCELCDLDADVDAIATALTQLGIEVEGVATPASEVRGVIAGRIVSMQSHPNADRLRLLHVDVGKGEPLTIVCGASNMREGDMVAVATIGARLPGGIKIKKSRIRGVVSHGMCCSAAELGLAESAHGILILPSGAPIGAPVAQVLGLEEAIFELSITPNRGDCMSIYGLARELAACMAAHLHPPAIKRVQVDTAVAVPVVTVADAADCPLYLARRLEGIALQESPAWMQARLAHCGMRPVNGVVDVLNYVMLELGQPMHAFDAEHLAGAIEVRRAGSGEAMLALDGRSLTLSSEDLVVADAKGPIALAGVMGAQHSGVGPETRDVVLESAVFQPALVSLAARRHGMVSEASLRFERGVDAAMVEQALERASDLIVSLFGGKAGGIGRCGDAAPLVRPRTIRLDAARMQARLGVTVPPRVDQVLARMGFDIRRREGMLTIAVPSHRHDVRLPEDVMEEYARVYGYDNIPEELPRWPLHVAESRRHDWLETAVAAGFDQVISYAFIAADQQRHFAPDADADVLLANPISQDMAVMRRSLWPGLLAAAGYNLNRQAPGVALVEQGRTYARKAGKIHEAEVLAWLLAGEVEAAEWYRRERAADFFDLKGALQYWFGKFGIAPTFMPADEEPGLQPGQCAVIHVNNHAVGRIGKVAAEVAACFGIEVPVFVAEIWLARLPQPKRPAFSPLPEQPSVTRDLVFLLDAELTAAEILAAAGRAGGGLLRQVRIFDRYKGKGVPAGKVSLGLRLLLQADARTLTQEEVDAVVSGVVAALEERFGATLRGG